jgi:propanol-preferring alcohol dehydrogenase
MRAMLFDGVGKPLREADLDMPKPGTGEVLLEVRTCAVCRTDLHVYEGDLPNPKLPLVLGHEIVGAVKEVGPGVWRFSPGDLVGVPWLGWTCGVCRHCRTGRENLCDDAKFTGYDLDGGFAEYTVADERFCFPIPNGYSPLQAAPLLCAGLIGYRSLRAAGDAERLGLYGFGAAAHIIAQVAVHQGRKVFAFTKPGDETGQDFARQMGAVWAGGSGTPPAGIHMSEIPAFPYDILWGERVLRSIANLTREDGEQFFRVAPQVPVRSEVQPYPLVQAEKALEDLRDGRVQGAAVLVVASGGQ